MTSHDLVNLEGFGHSFNGFFLPSQNQFQGNIKNPWGSCGFLRFDPTKKTGSAVVGCKV
jgi:hypothetical protein